MRCTNGSFHKIRSFATQVKLGTSELISSVEFRQFPCNRIPIRILSDEFRSVLRGSIDFQQIPGRNFAEPTGTFTAETGSESCCKEIVGIQRSRPKTNGIYRIRCRKTKKTIDSDSGNSGPGDFSVPIGTLRIRWMDFSGKHLKQSECVRRKPTESDNSVLSDLVPVRQDPMPPTLSRLSQISHQKNS